MNSCWAKNRENRWHGLIIVLVVVSLAGCQGLSAGSPSKQHPVSIGDLSLNTATLSFGNVVVSSSATLPITATNTGTASVTITGARTSTSQFFLSAPTLPLTITAGQTADLTISFSPVSAADITGTISLSSNASDGTLTLSLSGTGVAPGQLLPSPGNINFGAVLVGGTQNQSATLTNAGASSLTISQAVVTGTGFQMSGLTVPLTLNPGQSTQFMVSFAPQSSGAQSGSIVFTTGASASVSQLRMANFKHRSGKGHAGSTGSDTVSVSLSGSGTTPGQLTAAPTSVGFSNVQVGTSQSQTVTLNNSGGSSVSISQASTTGSGFSLSGISVPLTLAAGQNTTFTVSFAPQAAGTVNGNIALTSNASNSTLNVPLSGTALTPAALTANPSSVAFGSVQVGNSQQQTTTLTNTGGTSVTISQAVASGAGYSLSGLALPLNLAAGQSTSFTVAFQPQSAGSVNGSVAITSNAPNPNLTISLSGTGTSPATLSANPTSLNFGSVQVGNSKQLSQVVSNTGGANLTISQYTFTGSGFNVNGFTPPLTLTPGQSYTFTVTYAPQSAGAASGNISIASNASNPNLTIPLSGTGTAAGQLATLPTSLNFNNVVVGTSATQGATLTASGASVTVTSDNFSGSEFTLTGISLPLTIPAGNSASFSVTFAPQSTGTASATLSFSSNASNSPVMSLAGTGTAPPVHTVALSWTASTSSNVASYNIYRSTTSGGPYSEIDTVPESTTTFTDTAVTDGQTYYYVTTTVNADSQESSYSNQATAVIPPP
jgi:hypothetical protein